MSQSLSKILIHLVFSTKNRRPFLDEAIKEPLHAYIIAVFKNMGCPILAINSVDDHIHILFDLNRCHSVSQVVCLVKKSSSIWIKTQGNKFQSFAWQNGYGAFAVSESNSNRVIRYIQCQQDHHSKFNFNHELTQLLKNHRISYKREFLFD